MLVAAILAGLVVVSVSATPAQDAHSRGHSRGCLYIDGRCYRECPVDTHSYAPGCTTIRSERTCDNPVSTEGTGIICDYSSCVCDEPKVKDLTTGKCVLLEDCPKKAAGHINKDVQ